ncbi:hypothetical protein JW890_05950, partial [candidate division WOR-3 bacterium]|nr:hypothetical protein [candidate division WOR-3 bacterium]
RKYDSEADTGVIVANFSLLNTNWYIKQIHMQGFPLKFSGAFRNWHKHDIPVRNSNNFYSVENPAMAKWNEYAYKKHIKGDAEKERAWASLGELQKMEYSIQIANEKGDSFENWLLNEISIGYAVEYVPLELALSGGSIYPVEVLLPKDIAVRAIICAVNDVEFTEEILFMDTQEFAEFAGSITDPEAQYRVYFSSTCSQENMAKLEPWLKTEGLVYRVSNEKIDEGSMMFDNVDYAYTESLYTKEFRFRGIFTKKMLDDRGGLNMEGFLLENIERDENTLYNDEFARLASNYAAGFFVLGTNEIRKFERGLPCDDSKAVKFMKIGNLISKGNELQFTYYLVEAYKIAGMKKEAISLIDDFIGRMEERRKTEYILSEKERFTFSIGFFTAKKIYTLLYFGEDEEAKKEFSSLQNILKETSVQDFVILQSLFLYREGEKEEAEMILESAGLYTVDFSFVVDWIDQGVLKETGDSAFARFVVELYLQNTEVEESLIPQNIFGMQFVFQPDSGVE